MKNTLKASRENIGVVMDRLDKFIRKNAHKKFVINNVWGKPSKWENWSGNPINLSYIVPPKVKKHHYYNNANHNCLVGLYFSSEFDYLEILGDSSGGNPEEACARYISIGDVVEFTYDGILVMENNPFPGINKRLTWFLTTKH